MANGMSFNRQPSQINILERKASLLLLSVCVEQRAVGTRPGRWRRCYWLQWELEWSTGHLPAGRTWATLGPHAVTLWCPLSPGRGGLSDRAAEGEAVFSLSSGAPVCLLHSHPPPVEGSIGLYFVSCLPWKSILQHWLWKQCFAALQMCHNSLVNTQSNRLWIAGL